MKFLMKIFFLVSFFILPNCAHLLTTPKIQFLNEQIIEGTKEFQGLNVGGISGASFDNSSRRFFFLSDDKKNHRFYELQLKNKKPYKLEIVNQVFLRENQANRLQRNMDPEAILFHLKEKQILYSL